MHRECSAQSLRRMAIFNMPEKAPQFLAKIGMSTLGDDQFRSFVWGFASKIRDSMFCDQYRNGMFVVVHMTNGRNDGTNLAAFR